MEISLDIDCAVLEVPMRLDIADMRRSAEFWPPRAYIERDVYAGPYEVVPSSSGQVLATAGKAMTRDVAVGAIPSNYGLITWNGSTLTVS